MLLSQFKKKSVVIRIRINFPANLQITIDVAVAGQAGLLHRPPVVVRPAALAVGSVRVVPAAHAVPPAASAAVLLHVKEAAVRPPAAVALCGPAEEEEKGRIR